MIFTFRNTVAFSMLVWAISILIVFKNFTTYFWIQGTKRQYIIEGIWGLEIKDLDFSFCTITYWLGDIGKPILLGSIC